VDVEGVPEVLAGHRRAFQVPAGPAAAPRRRPGGGLGIARLVALPQGEVARVALAALLGVLGGRHLVDPHARQLAVVGPGAHVEVDVARAVRRRVGVATVDQGGDQLDHLRDVAGRARLVRGGPDAEGAERLVEGPLVQVGVRPPGAAGLGGLRQDLVVDVGDVGDHRHPVTGRLEPAPQDVEVDFLADVTQVGRRLHGGAAAVDRDLALDEGHELDHGPAGAVIQVERHPRESTGARRGPARRVTVGRGSRARSGPWPCCR